MANLAAMLRNPECSEHFTSKKSEDLKRLIEIILSQETDIRIVEQGILIFRLLLQTKRSYKSFVEAFPRLEEKILDLLVDFQHKFYIGVHLINC